MPFRYILSVSFHEVALEFGWNGSS